MALDTFEGRDRRGKFFFETHVFRFFFLCWVIACTVVPCRVVKQHDSHGKNQLELFETCFEWELSSEAYGGWMLLICIWDADDQYDKNQIWSGVYMRTLHRVINLMHWIVTRPLQRMCLFTLRWCQLTLFHEICSIFESNIIQHPKCTMTEHDTFRKMAAPTEADAESGRSLWHRLMVSMVLVPGRFEGLDAVEVKTMITSQGGCCALMIDW